MLNRIKSFVKEVLDKTGFNDELTAPRLCSECPHNNYAKLPTPHCVIIPRIESCPLQKTSRGSSVCSPDMQEPAAYAFLGYDNELGCNIVEYVIFGYRMTSFHPSEDEAARCADMAIDYVKKYIMSLSHEQFILRVAHRHLSPITEWDLRHNASIVAIAGSLDDIREDAKRKLAELESEKEGVIAELDSIKKVATFNKPGSEE